MPELASVPLHTDDACAAPPSVEIASDANAAEWDSYVTAHVQGTVDHVWRWRSVFSGVFGHACEYLVARRGRQISGVLPLVRFDSKLIGRAVISLPFLNYGGVLASDPASAKVLLRRAEETGRDFGAKHLELRHVDRRFSSLAERLHKLKLDRPLPSDAEALWARLDRKIRNQVRKAQKDGLIAHIGGAELVNEFYAVFAHNMRDLGTPVYPQRLFSETLRLFPDTASVFVVRKDAATAAAGIAIRHGGTVLVPWASSLREYRHLCANTLLYWTMVEHATKSGATMFDFGRSTPGSGPHQFKLQWGAVETPMHWEYSLFGGHAPPTDGPQSPKFAAAIAVWKRLPLGLTRALGPSIVRHLP